MNDKSLKSAYNNKSSDIIEKIKYFRNKYVEDRYIFVDGRTVEKILLQIGADPVGLKTLKDVSDALVSDPTLPFRRSKNGRFEFDFANDRLTRLQFQPFVLTAEEHFIRHDSGVVRRFRGIQDDVQRNTAFIALMRFKAWMIDGLQTHRRPLLDYDTPNWISTVFHVRTVTNDKALGEPAAEGVHCDGVDHTMTTFIGAKNMRPDSAVSKIHDMKQVTGTPWDRIDETLVCDTLQHRSFLDTLFIFDNERKHTVSPVFQLDPANESQRDMLVVFTRKPAVVGHVSFAHDSRTPHPDMPMEVALRHLHSSTGVADCECPDFSDQASTTRLPAAESSFSVSAK